MFTISSLLDQFLTNHERPIFNTLAMTVHVDEDVEHRKFRASDAGRCHLYQYWKRQGKEQPAKGVHELKVMEMGNLVHAWLEYALLKAGVLHNAELLVEDDHRTGHADALVRLNGKPVLYDVKTVGAKQAWYMLNNGAKAKREHQYQVLTYLEMITADPSNPFAAGLEEAHILYLTREEVNGKQGDKLPPLTVAWLAWVPGVVWFALKTSLFLFCFLWLRATFPRYRYDQIMRLGWKVFIPITIIWLFVEGLMVWFGVGPWFS